MWISVGTLFSRHVVTACFSLLHTVPLEHANASQLGPAPEEAGVGSVAEAFSTRPPESDAPGSLRPDCWLPRCIVSVGRRSPALRPTVPPALRTAHTGAGWAVAAGQLWGPVRNGRAQGIRGRGSGSFLRCPKPLGLHPLGLLPSRPCAGHKGRDFCLLAQPSVSGSQRRLLDKGPSWPALSRH